MNASLAARRALVLGIPLVALSVAGIGRAAAPPRPAKAPAGPPGVPLERMRDAVENDTLLRPDRRFVLAFEELSRFCGGAARAAETASGRRWTLDVGLRQKAGLPGIPAFADALEQLRAVAVTPGVPRGGAPVSEADAIRLRTRAADAFTDGPIRALEEIDRLWASGADRRFLLDVASLAYVTLLVQLPDSFEMGDAVAGRALGLLALSETASGVRRKGRAEVLSDAMGYASPAPLRRDARPTVTIPRHAFPGDEKRYGPTGSGADTSPDARYLSLLEEARSRTVPEMQARLRALGAANRAPGVRLLLQCRRERLDANLELGSALVVVAFAEAGVPKPDQNSPVVPQFEKAVASLPPVEGLFWNTETRDARLRALFYSGLADIGAYYLDQLSSGPGAAGFARILEGAETGPGAEMRRLYGHLAEVKTGRRPAGQLLADLDALPSLGQAAVRRLGDALMSSLHAMAPELPAAGAKLAERLDSRPANRRLFGRACQSALLDPLAFRAYTLAASPRTALATETDAWLAHTLGDVGRLRSIAAEPSVPARPRVVAVEYLDDVAALPGDELRRLLLDILGRDPDTWSAMRSVRLLWEHGLLAEAEGALRSRLARSPQSPVLERAVWASRLEHVLFLSGRYQEAWTAIEPHLSTWKGDALGAGAEALLGLGKAEEAVKMAEECLERYPDDAMTRTGLAKILWRLGRVDAAAKPLLDPRFPLSSEDWRVLVPREFVEVYRNRPSGEAVRAVEALVRAGTNAWFAFEICSRFERAGAPETAIALLDAVSRSKGETIDGTLRAYRFRRRAHGADAADRWFREKVVPSRSASWVAETAFDEREFDLLWLLPDTEDRWLLRAAAAAFEGRPEGPRLQRLRSHFRDSGASRLHALDGRYLLGEASDADLLASATESPRRGQAAFLLGVKAAGEKRLEDANAWLRVAVRAGPATAAACRHATEMLKRWDVRRFGVAGGAEIR